MNNMQKKIKHLEFIQTIIGRQAKNSFLLKGWIVTLVAATFVLPIDDAIDRKSILVYFLIVIFGLLNTYYLWQEKKFRCLFDHVRKFKDDKVDFDMNTTEIAKKTGCSWIDALFSPPIYIFYLTLMLFTITFLNWR